MRWLPLVLLVACSDYTATEVRDTANQFGGELDAVLLRVDVHPPSESVGELLPQTFQVDLSEEQSDQGVRLVLSRPVEVRGKITGYRVSPWEDADLPGEDVPVQARITFRRASSAQVVHTTSDDRGRYSATVVPDFDYRMSIVPDDAEIPLETRSVAVEEESTLDVELGEGMPLWGRVDAEDEEPLAGARVQAVDYAGATSTVVLSDDEGRYLVRVVEGSYAVVCRGRDNGRDPTLSTGDLGVGPEGARVDFTYAQLDTVTVSGRLLSSDGMPQSRATVRFAALSLDGYDQSLVSSTQEALPNSSGTWDLRLLPGSYRVDVLPDEEEPSSPLSLGVVSVSRNLDLGPLLLTPHQAVLGRVVDPWGAPVAGAVLRVAEVDYGRREWALASDAHGDFEASLPQVDLEFTLSPPGDRAGELSTTRVVVPPADGEGLLLPFRQGSRVRGMVLDPVERPLEYAVVEVRDDAGDLWALTLTDEDGRFDIGVAWTP